MTPNTRICPLCRHNFMRGKKNDLGVSCCPDCGVELYYDKDKDGSPITVLMSEHRERVDTAKKILRVFYDFSDVEPPKEFNPSLWAAELKIANSIIEKSELFLSSVPKSGPDLCPYEFALLVVEETARGWRGTLVTPAQILGYMTTPANLVYKRKKQAWDQFQALRSSNPTYADVKEEDKRIDGLDVRSISWT